MGIHDKGLDLGEERVKRGFLPFKKFMKPRGWGYLREEGRVELLDKVGEALFYPGGISIEVRIEVVDKKGLGNDEGIGAIKLKLDGEGGEFSVKEGLGLIIFNLELRVSKIWGHVAFHVKPSHVQGSF